MITLTRRQCLTTAPEEYDYCWARTLILNVATDGRGRSLRLVENEDDWHFQQQMLRYGSGLHLTIDRQSVLADQVGYGLVKLTDNPVHIDTDVTFQTMKQLLARMLRAKLGYLTPATMSPPYLFVEPENSRFICATLKN